MHASALSRFYHSYLESQDSAGFIKAIASRYQVATLAALVRRGDVTQRRAAALALGYLGDFSVNSVMGPALADSDRGVRMIAESGIQNVWMSVGTVTQRRQLNVADRLIAAGQIREAMRLTSIVLQQNPNFAEASRLSGVANFGGGLIRAARSDFRHAIFENPYQFQAAIGLANCCARIGDGPGSLRWFQRALRINPELEMIRLHVAQLTRSTDQS